MAFSTPSSARQRQRPQRPRPCGHVRTWLTTMGLADLATGASSAANCEPVCRGIAVVTSDAYVHTTKERMNTPTPDRCRVIAPSTVVTYSKMLTQNVSEGNVARNRK